MSQKLPKKIHVPVCDTHGSIVYDAIDKGALIQRILDFLRQSEQLREDGRATKRKVHRGQFRSEPVSWRLLLPHAASKGPSSQDLLEVMQPLLAFRQGDLPLNSLYFPALETEDYEREARCFIEDNLEIIDETSCILMVGDPADLPFALQRLLMIEGIRVGRLSFDKLEHYGTYVEKVLSQQGRESKVLKESGARSILGSSTEHDEPTETVARILTQPILDKIEERIEGGDLPEVSIRRLQGAEVKSTELQDVLGGDGSITPIFWLHSSHGVECRGDFANASHGALVDNLGGFLSAKMVQEHPEKAFLPGGIAVLAACYGGGTPRERAWAQVLLPESSSLRPETDLVSALPKALLAHKYGPLGVVAHVDMLFIQGFDSADGESPRDSNSPGIWPIRQLCTRLLGGEPLAFAFQSMVRGAIRSEASLRDVLQDLVRATDDEELAEAIAINWLRWHDANHWIVLGDPLVALGAACGAISIGGAMRGG